MAYQPKNETIEKMCKHVFNEEMTEQLLTIAKRINSNTNTVSIDCTYKVPGDVGYQAYQKMIQFANNVSANPNSKLDMFCEHYSKSDIWDNAQLYDLLIQINDDTSGTNEKIADYFMDNKEIFYNLVGITERDLNT